MAKRKKKSEGDLRKELLQLTDEELYAVYREIAGYEEVPVDIMTFMSSNDYMGNFSIRLAGFAGDPGADDLGFLWEFSDGTVITSDYPNPGGVYPVSITDSVDYTGPASGVTLTVTDDDGGTCITSITF